MQVIHIKRRCNRGNTHTNKNELLKLKTVTLANKIIQKKEERGDEYIFFIILNHRYLRSAPFISIINIEKGVFSFFLPIFLLLLFFLFLFFTIPFIIVYYYDS